MLNFSLNIMLNFAIIIALRNSLIITTEWRLKSKKQKSMFLWNKYVSLSQQAKDEWIEKR